MLKLLTRRQWLQCIAFGGGIMLTSCIAEDSPPSSAVATLPATEEEAANEIADTDTSLQGDGQEIDLAVKIGQMFMVGFRGLAVDENHPIVRDIVERHLGGVVLFDYDVPNREFVRNIESPEQLQALTRALQATAQESPARQPLLIAADQEGGVVVRLSERYGFPPTVSHAALGAGNDVQETFARASEMARTLAEMGINQNLAPVVDVNVNPENPVIAAYERSFSANPQVVIAQATAFIEAHHAQNVLCTLKHFPGHGSSRADTHRGFVDVSDTWSRLELEPYAALIDAGLADGVMTAHVVNQAWHATDPATLTPDAIDGLLRDELGYTGVVISDDVQMGAIRKFYSFEESIEKAITAGVDIIAIANNSIYDEDVMAMGVTVVQRLIEAGTITEARIDQSYRRIVQLKSRIDQRAHSRQHIPF